MKYFACLILLFTVGCSLPFTVARPNAPVYGPDTLLTVIDDLQNTAIEKEAAKQLSTSSTRMIVQFVVNTAKLVKSSGTNVAWKQIVGANLKQVRMDLPVADEVRFSAKFNLIKDIVEKR